MKTCIHCDIGHSILCYCQIGCINRHQYSIYNWMHVSQVPASALVSTSSTYTPCHLILKPRTYPISPHGPLSKYTSQWINSWYVIWKCSETLSPQAYSHRHIITREYSVQNSPLIPRIHHSSPPLSPTGSPQQVPNSSQGTCIPQWHCMWQSDRLFYHPHSWLLSKHTKYSISFPSHLKHGKVA